MASLWDDASTRAKRLPLHNMSVREKLSSLVRRGSTRKLKTTPSVANISAPILEVDFTRVKSLPGLAEGWLEDSSSAAAAKSPEQQREHRDDGRGAGARESRDHRERDPEQRYSRTPISDLYAMSTDRLASTLEQISRKPAPTVPAPAPAPVPTSNLKREPEPEPQPIRISLRDSTVVVPVVAPEATKPSAQSQSRRRTVMPGPWATTTEAPANPRASLESISSRPDEFSRRHSVRQVNLLRSVGENTTGLRVSTGGGTGTGSGSGSGLVDSTTKRYSVPEIKMPMISTDDFEAQLANPPSVPVLEVKTMAPPPQTRNTNASLATPTLTPTTSLSDNPRRRSWQPAAPVLIPQNTGSSTTQPQRTPSTRRPPSAALTSSRLAWIRELENKNKSSSSSPGTSASDLQKLAPKSYTAGVASKLAMFEHIQKSQTPKPAAVSRSNSTVSRTSKTSSRVSSGGHTALSMGGAADGGVSTARTSIDFDAVDISSRSQRNSAIMAYYDEGFRERMEGVAGGLAKQIKGGDEEGEGEQVGVGLKKVTAKLVEVQIEKAGRKDAPEEEPLKEAPEEKTEITAADAVAVTESVEPAKEEMPQALEPSAVADEPSAVNGEPAQPEQELINAAVSEAEPSSTSFINAPVAATEEPAVTDAIIETKMKDAYVDTKLPQPLLAVSEAEVVSPQEVVEEAPKEEAVEAPVEVVQEEDTKVAQAGSEVAVQKSEVRVTVEPAVDAQSAAPLGVEAR